MCEQLNMTAFRLLRDRLREAFGLLFEDEKYPRVAKAIESRMAALGIDRLSEYEPLLTSLPDRGDEWRELAALLTVGETHFFRNGNHWRAFEECVLPWIVERSIESDRRLIRIWSAGCSTGEEPYTAAILLNRSVPNRADWSVEIVGTDINPAALLAARRAVYGEHSFRGTPPGIREEYFEKIDAGSYLLRDEIRRMVRFQEMNLLDEAATGRMRGMDVIFCRNVLIYFDAAGVRRALTEFHRALKPGGYLFLGHAEGLPGKDHPFVGLHVCDTFLCKSLPRAVQAPGPLGPGESELMRGDPADAPPPTAIRKDRTPESEAPASVASAATPEEDRLHALRVCAIDHLLADECDEAQRAFERVLRREPNDRESLLGMALLLASKRSGSDALGCCERVLQARPLSAEAYYVKALVHEGLGEETLAQRELEKAVYLDEGFSIARFRLARLHRRARREDAARREFRNALQALPGDEERRVRLYSGGFGKRTVARMCRQQLGIETEPVPCVPTSSLDRGSCIRGDKEG